MPQPDNLLLKNSAIFVQNACLQHKYIRSKDTSNIVERPERLRAINVGLSAAIARLENLFTTSKVTQKGESDSDSLVEVMNKLNLESDRTSDSTSGSVAIVQSQAIVDILSHPAVKFVHGDIERDVYLENLSEWIMKSHDKIAKGESEIPEGYSQGDLYRKSLAYLPVPLSKSHRIENSI